MKNKSLTEWLENNNNINKSVATQPINEEERVDEFLLTLTAACVFAYCCQPLLNSEFAKQVGGGFGSFFRGMGGLLGGIGGLFGFGKKKDKDDDDRGSSRGSNNDDDDEDEKNAAGFAIALNTAEQETDKLEDGDDKTKAQGVISLIKGASVDENGRLKPVRDIRQSFEDKTGKSFQDVLTGIGIDPKSIENSEKNNDEVKKLIDDKLKNMSQDDLTELISEHCESAKRRAKDMKELSQVQDLEQMAGLIKIQKDEDKLFEEYKDKIDKAESEDDKKKLQDELKSKQKELDTKRQEFKDKIAKEKKTADELEQAKKENDEINKQIDDLDNQKKKLEDEYKDKIDKAESEDDKKKLQDELKSKQDDIEKQKNELVYKVETGGDDGEAKGTTSKEEEVTIDVKDEKGNTVKDEKGNIVKKKVKKKVYTGPRGGKYYYPDGKAKTPDNRQYVESTLSQYLSNIFFE